MGLKTGNVADVTRSVAFAGSQLVGLEMDEIQMRQRHWTVVKPDRQGRSHPHRGHSSNASKPHSTSGLPPLASDGKILRAVARTGNVGVKASRRALWYRSRRAAKKRVWDALRHSTYAGPPSIKHNSGNDDKAKAKTSP